jgi:Zn-dependent M16 (insulinase) family peptidase
VLSRFERIEPDSSVPSEVRLTEPRQVTESYPLDAGESLEKKSLVQIAWLACDIEDSFERLALTVLSTLLLGNPAAPLYQALLDSGLGDNLAPGTGYQDDNRTTYFAAGLQGTDPQQLPAIEKLVLETLEATAAKGFSAERVEGVLHRLEIANREVTGDSYPYALILLMRLIGSWMHGGDPVTALNFEAHVERLRKELKAGPFFENLLRRTLLDNPHRVSLLLKPDTELGPLQEAETRRELEALRARLSAADRAEILARAAQLQQSQEAEEDLSCLPTLELSDIDRQEQAVPVVEETLQSAPVCWFDQPTNGIGFVTLNFPLRNLSPELLPYLPIFCSLLTQVGAGERDYLQMAERLEAVTGGIQARTSLLETPDDLETFEAGIQVKGKALLRNLPALFELLADVCLAPDFSDLKRLQTVLNQIKISLENSVPASGHTYAARSAAACLTPVARLREMWSGLEQVSMVVKQAEQPLAQLQGLADNMQAIARALFCRDQLQAAIAVEREHFTAARAPLAAFLGLLPNAAQAAEQELVKELTSARRQGRIWSLPVSYVTKVFRAVPYRHPHSAALMVLAKLLRAEYLHREIREKGGAYGGMASYNAESGLFSLLSYRDPHILRTLKVYDAAVDWVISGDFSDESVKEAILAVFSDLDRPLSPAGQAAQEFANLRQGLTLEMRNQLRGLLLAVDRRALIGAAETYLRQEAADCAVSVLAGEAALERANAELGAAALAVQRI